MRIFIAGASGFIGKALRLRFEAEGHDVVCASRTTKADHAYCIDFGQPDPGHWIMALQGCDLAINAVGIFSEQPGQQFADIHQHGAQTFYEACLAAGVPRVVAISASGAGPDSPPFLHSKYLADQYLLGLPLDAMVVRPPLVYGTGGHSARLLRLLASLPLLALPAGGRQPLQCLHIDDLCRLITAQINQPRFSQPLIEPCGHAPVSLRNLLAALRAGMGFSQPAVVLSIPPALAGLFARLADCFPATRLFGRQSLQLMDQLADRYAAGSNPDARPVTALIDAGESAALRQQALAGWRGPLLRTVLALLWLVTALVSLLVWPVNDSLALLARTGLHGLAGWLALGSASLLDLFFGLATLLRPGRRLWLAQLAVIVLYSLIIALHLPEYLAHPFGPITKNLPIVALLFILYCEEERP